VLTHRTNSDDDGFAELKRQLRRWVVRQSVFVGFVVAGVALVVTHSPFGMGGPNYPLAAIFALAAAGMVALVGRARAFLHIQRILAGIEARSFEYRLGKIFGRNLRRWLGGRQRPMSCLSMPPMTHSDYVVGCRSSRHNGEERK
jgi:hypothetical protein